MAAGTSGLRQTRVSGASETIDRRGSTSDPGGACGGGHSAAGCAELNRRAARPGGERAGGQVGAGDAV